MTPEIRVAATSGLIADVYEQLLEPHFPASELSACEDIIADVTTGRTEVLVAQVDGALLGAIVGERFGATMLIAWIATSPPGRSRGIGSALLSAGTARWSALPGIEVILAEVERPDRHTANPQYGDPQRRIAFYARAGAAALALPYFQPSLGDGLPRVTGVLLVILAMPEPESASPVLTPMQATAVQEYLTAAIGPLHPGDIEHERLLHAATDPNGIRVVPIEEFGQIPI